MTLRSYAPFVFTPVCATPGSTRWFTARTTPSGHTTYVVARRSVFVLPFTHTYGHLRLFGFTMILPPRRLHRARSLFVFANDSRFCVCRSRVLRHFALRSCCARSLFLCVPAPVTFATLVLDAGSLRSFYARCVLPLSRIHLPLVFTVFACGLRFTAGFGFSVCCLPLRCTDPVSFV